MKKIIQKILDSKFGAILFIIVGVIISPFVAIFKWKKIKSRLHDESKVPDFFQYLERISDNDTSFIKITCENTWVKIEQGEFLGPVSKSSHGKKSIEEALKWSNQLVKDKISEGFQKTDYVETKENSMTRYDDWDWHEIPEDLDSFQGYLPGGMYLGWAIDQGLVNPKFLNETGLKELIEDFKDRKISGSKIYEKIDGVLDKELFNKKGNRFSLDYFDTYLKELKTIICTDLPSIYHLEDSWDNFSKVSVILDEKLDKHH